MKSRFNPKKIILWLVLALIVFLSVYVVTFDIEVGTESVQQDITAQAIK